MDNIKSELVHLIHKGRAAAFAIELQQLEEDGQKPSLEAETFRKLTINKFHFKGIDFTNVAFEQCNISECTFEACDLEGTFFDGATILESKFIGCKGEGFAMDTCTIIKSSFEGLDLESPEWNDTQFQDCQLTRVEMQEPLLERITFRNGTFNGVTIVSGDLTHVELREVEGIETFSISESEAQRCYVVGIEDESLVPEGFSQKTGRRRTL